MKLAAAIDAFIADVCAGKTNETPRAYSAKLRRMLAGLGDVEMRRVTPADLDQFRLDLLAGSLSIWYVRGVLATCKHFWCWAYDTGRIRNNPAARLKIPKEPPHNPQAISDATFARLLEAACTAGKPVDRSRNAALLLTLRDTGGRIGGVLSAQMAGLDLERGVMTVIEKGGQMRFLLLNPPTVQALRTWIEARETINPRTDYVFISAEGKARGKPLTRSGVYSLLARLAHAAGLDASTRINPHSFRHAFAIDSLMNGADLSQVSQMMGHSSIRVTADYYARFGVARLQEVHRKTSPVR